MAEKTKIEWTDSTLNPWIGCTKVSPACDHCYAEVSAPARTHAIVWGPKAERVRTKPGTWNLARRWNAQHQAFFREHGRRQRVFCASLSDVFDNAVPEQWRADLFELVMECDKLDWLLLTKRVGNVAKMVPPSWLKPGGWPKHVRIGATIATQEDADRDIKTLVALGCPNFLSMEPLLESVSIWRWLAPHCERHPGKLDTDGKCEVCEGRGIWGVGDDHLTEAEKAPIRKGIDWVIVGGESGHGARPMNPWWARHLRDQCEKEGVPFLFKQWGEWTPGELAAHPEHKDGGAWRLDQRGERWHALEEASMPEADRKEVRYLKVGKKLAGRMLDGRTWDGYP